MYSYTYGTESSGSNVMASAYNQEKRRVPISRKCLSLPAPTFAIVDVILSGDKPANKISYLIVVVLSSSIDFKACLHEQNNFKGPFALTSLTPLTMARMVAFLGPSTVRPSSVGPQLAE